MTALAPSRPTLRGNWERNQSLLPTLAAVALFIGMLVYAELAYGRVFHAGTMSSLLVSFAPTIILAVGMTIVILSGGIDLSVGAVVAFTSVSGVMLMNAGVNGWLAIVLMIVFGGLFGLVAGILIQYFTVQPFIATLAMMFLARGLASMLSTVPVHAPDDAPIRLIATDWKIIDGPKVNDLVLTPGFVLAVFVVILALPNMAPQLKTIAIMNACMPMMSIYPILGQKYGKEGICAAALIAATALSFFTISGFLWLSGTG